MIVDAPIWRTRAHPRVCGENRPGISCSVRRGGSSPRVRGKRPGSEPSRDPRGLIPACAGKTHTAKFRRWLSAAHPRVCGENELRPRGGPRGEGSSPRVRGKRQIGVRLGEEPGLIPACAGKTSGRGSPRRSRRAHPRVCGENAIRMSFSFTLSGSSPRVRGKQASRLGFTQVERLIPACAGKTTAFHRPPSQNRAHPRVCGENSTWNRRLVA